MNDPVPAQENAPQTASLAAAQAQASSQLAQSAAAQAAVSAAPSPQASVEAPVAVPPAPNVSADASAPAATPAREPPPATVAATAPSTTAATAQGANPPDAGSSGEASEPTEPAPPDEDRALLDSMLALLAPLAKEGDSPLDVLARVIAEPAKVQALTEDAFADKLADWLSAQTNGARVSSNTWITHAECGGVATLLRQRAWRKPPSKPRAQ